MEIYTQWLEKLVKCTTTKTKIESRYTKPLKLEVFQGDKLVSKLAGIRSSLIYKIIITNQINEYAANNNILKEYSKWISFTCAAQP